MLMTPTLILATARPVLGGLFSLVTPLALLAVIGLWALWFRRRQH